MNAVTVECIILATSIFFLTAVVVVVVVTVAFAFVLCLPLLCFVTIQAREKIGHYATTVNVMNWADLLSLTWFFEWY